MNWTPHLVTVAAAGPVLTLDDVRGHVRADTDDDAALAAYLAAAVDMVEEYTGTKLLTQTIQMTRADLCASMPLPVGPIQSVTLTYLDTTGTSQTLNPSLYALVGTGTLSARIVQLTGRSWPALLDHPAAVTLSAVAGYGPEAANVPQVILQAIRLLVGDFYANREDTIAERSVVPATLPNGVAALLANRRMY